MFNVVVDCGNKINVYKRYRGRYVIYIVICKGVLGFYKIMIAKGLFTLMTSVNCLIEIKRTVRYCRKKCMFQNGMF